MDYDQDSRPGMYYVLVSPGQGAAPKYAGFFSAREHNVPLLWQQLKSVAIQAGVPCFYLVRVERLYAKDITEQIWEPTDAPRFISSKDLAEFERVWRARFAIEAKRMCEQGLLSPLPPADEPDDTIDCSDELGDYGTQKGSVQFLP